MNPFLKAIDLLNEHGWNQGDYEGEDGSLCIKGALIQAVYGDFVFNGKIRQVVSVGPMIVDADNVNDIFIDTFRSVSPADWNDDPLRTAEDVKLRLKEMARLWEERYE